MEREPIIPKTRQTVNRRGGEGAGPRSENDASPVRRGAKGAPLAPRRTPVSCPARPQVHSVCDSLSSITQYVSASLPSRPPKRVPHFGMRWTLFRKEISRGSHRRRNRGGPAHNYRYILGGKKVRGEFYPFSCVGYRFAGINLPVVTG